ncbi:MAG: PqqD family protein [Roseobacter sp.]|uniref:PqqD family protein n=1 Tax=Parasphingorhabdus sp. TaxID=2709688 RepID=UPI00326345C2
MTAESNETNGAAPSGKLTISENALLEDMGDEAVILNINNERYYGLDRNGINFWTWLKEEGDVDKALARAVAAYDNVDADTLKKDLGVFVVELNNAGLLTFHEADS